MRFSKSTFIVFFISTVVLACMIWRALDKPKLNKHKLVIGILSARENFIQRNTIRSTWLSVVNNTVLFDEVLVKFILANQDCDIPAEYRKDPYSCEETRNVNFDLKGSVDIAHRAYIDNQNFRQYSRDYVTVGFDFTVTFDVILSGISVPSTNGQNIAIQLWNLASDSLVTNARNPYYDNTTKKYIFDVDLHLLPKGFIGSIIVVCDKQTSCVGVKNWFHNNFHPALEISPIVRYSLKKGEFPIHILPVNLEDMILPASLIIEYADVAQLRNYVQGRESAFRTRLHHNYEIFGKLCLEIQEHNDILIVSDIVETYRNIPRKLVAFHEYVAENLDADFIMKTDDDSYVDVEKIYQIVQHLEQSTHSTLGVWMGNFRRDWIVDRWGKWAEYQYTASVYPAYACGAGNLVSHNVSKYIANNSGNLKVYEGEDVSMGIWMSALNVDHIQDDQFKCDNSCDPNMVVSTQHSISDLKLLWENKKKCGNPCHCF